eukprot:3936472-Rhodomonas_salina.1
MSRTGSTSPSVLSAEGTPAPSPQRYPQLQRRPSRHSSSREPSALLEPEDEYDVEMCADEIVSYGRRNFIELFWDAEFNVTDFMRTWRYAHAHSTAKHIHYTPVPGCLAKLGWRDVEGLPDFPACSATPFDKSITMDEVLVLIVEDCQCEACKNPSLVPK